MNAFKTMTMTTALVTLLATFSFAKDEPLANWQPKFAPSKAEYNYLLSCVGHPAIEGVGVD